MQVKTGRSALHHSVGSPDGTRKFLLQLYDGRIVEVRVWVETQRACVAMCEVSCHESLQADCWHDMLSND
jgi:23S rRNA (adenine2503-C2)-methyltransferase